MTQANRVVNKLSSSRKYSSETEKIPSGHGFEKFTGFGCRNGAHALPRRKSRRSAKKEVTSELHRVMKADDIRCRLRDDVQI